MGGSDSYDVAVIGAGVSGANIARKLSSYAMDVALVDKECDVSFGTSKSNSGIVHGGFHHSAKHLKARLEIRGSIMFDQLQKELGFPFRRCGILVVATHHEELKVIPQLYAQGVENGSIGIEMCSPERMLELEPKLSGDVLGGLHAPAGGIIEPYRFVFCLVESARKNGVRLLTEFKVTAGAFDGSRWRVSAEDGRSLTAKYVINAAGLFADEVSRAFKAEQFSIIPRKGEYFLLDRSTPACPSRVLFPVPTHNSKGVLVIPTVEGTVLVGPTARDIEDKRDLSTTSEELEKIFDFAKRLVPGISQADVITTFAGLRPVLRDEDFLIDFSGTVPQFIQVAGIQSTGPDRLARGRRVREGPPEKSGCPAGREEGLRSLPRAGPTPAGGEPVGGGSPHQNGRRLWDHRLPLREGLRSGDRHRNQEGAHDSGWHQVFYAGGDGSMPGRLLYFPDTSKSS